MGYMQDPPLRSAISWGLLACILCWSSDWPMSAARDMASGMFLSFDLWLRTDQKRLGLHFRSDSIEPKNASRLTQIKRFTLLRMPLNFFLRYSDVGDRFNFWRVVSFFLIKLIIWPFIQGTGFLPFNLFLEIWSATPAKKTSLQHNCSVIWISSSFSLRSASWAVTLCKYWVWLHIFPCQVSLASHIDHIRIRCRLICFSDKETRIKIK